MLTLAVSLAVTLTGCGKSGSDVEAPAVEPLGFDTLEAAYEALAKAVKDRDAATFRRLLAKEPGAVKKFDDGVEELLEVAGSIAKAQDQFIELFEYRSYRYTLHKQGNRYPPVIDGDRAFIVAAYIDTQRKEAKHDIVTFKLFAGKWYYHELTGADLAWFDGRTAGITLKFPPAEPEAASQ